MKAAQINQQNTYCITDAMGRRTEMYITAPNLKEALKLAKQQYPNELYFGKLVRCYNGGVRG